MFKATMAFKGRIQDYNFKLTEKHKNIIYQLIDYRLKDKRQEWSPSIHYNIFDFICQS